MSNNNQSSVQWLIDKIKNHIDAEDGSMSMNWLHDGTLEQAKAMHKEEIIEARVDGDTWSTAIKEMRRNYAELYYNETFNTHENNNRI